MTKNDFSDWKSHPMTKAVFEALRYREAQIKDTLALSAGQHPTTDAEFVGYIKALRDFYLVEYNDLEESQE